MQAETIVDSNGQVTLPIATSIQLGIRAASHSHFEVHGQQLMINALPISAYYVMLKGYELGNIEPDKEPNRIFE